VGASAGTIARCGLKAIARPDWEKRSPFEGSQVTRVG
jgi:hypothetical protein